MKTAAKAARQAAAAAHEKELLAAGASPETAGTILASQGATLPETPAAQPSLPVSALSSDNGRAWLAQHLLEAEEAERSGPDGQGWQYNEALRAGITEHAEFLRALVALLYPL